MRIEEYFMKEYKELLNNRLDTFRKTLYDKGFMPDAAEVWRMYTNSFYENNGIYKFTAKLLNIELYDKNGRLNECCMFLDDINKKLSDLCSEYVLNVMPRFQKLKLLSQEMSGFNKEDDINLLEEP